MNLNQLTNGTDQVACTLSTTDMAAQARRWDQLIAQAMTSSSQTTDGIRLRFRNEPSVQAELDQLVAVERQCCPWASWTVRSNDSELVLEARATGLGVATLHTFDGRSGD
jgi:hypothetical protein